MPESRTDLVVNARTRGFQKAQSDTTKLGREGAKATSGVGKEITRLEESLKKLAIQQTKVADKMVAAGDKGSAAYKKLANELKTIQRESTGVEKALRGVDRAFQEAGRKAEREQQVREQRRGSFAQGLLQGAIPRAAYLQRGPGMARQAAGAAIGGAAAGVGRGLGMTPFIGAQGIAQALQSIPGGGLLAAPLMQSMAQAQGALQFRGQRQQLAPFLQMGMQAPGTVGETPAQQRQRISRQVDETLAKQGTIQRIRAPVTDIFTGPGRTVVGELFKAFKGATGGGRPEWGALERARGREVAAAGGEEAYAAIERREMVERAIAKEGVSRPRRRTLQDIVRAGGQQLGFALPEAMQMMGGITQAGGGVGRELVTQQMGTAGMAAQRLYGVGAGVSGAFLQAGRRGGVVGAQGRAGEAFTEALAGAVRMGLEGSELTEYMDQMAGDIRSWKTTGISIDPTSLAAAGAGLATMGLGAVRGGVMARGLAARAREVSVRGPRGAEELMMLQTLGGFRGGGAAELEEAQLKLQKGKLDPEAIKRLMGRFMAAGGGGAAGRAVGRGAMGRLGIGIGIEESRLIQKQLEGGTLSETEQAALTKAQEERETGAAAAVGGGPAGLLAAAAGVTDVALRRQAAQANKQLAIGDTLIKTMQNLEESASSINKGFTTLAAGPLTDLTGQIRDLSGEIPGATAAFRRLWEVSGEGEALVSTAAE